MLAPLLDYSRTYDLEAQYLVCDYLVRACRTALFELALDEVPDPGARLLAMESLKEIREDWTRARRDVRRQRSGERLRRVNCR